MKIFELLDSPEKWTQRVYARDSDGKAIFNPDSRNAVSWCLEGACIKCYGDGRSVEGVGKILDKIRSLGHGAVWVWNDAPERTYEDVINLCKELDV